MFYFALQTLPYEVLHNVNGYLSFSESGNFRRTCKNFADCPPNASTLKIGSTYRADLTERIFASGYLQSLSIEKSRGFSWSVFELLHAPHLQSFSLEFAPYTNDENEPFSDVLVKAIQNYPLKILELNNITQTLFSTMMQSLNLRDLEALTIDGFFLQLSEDSIASCLPHIPHLKKLHFFGICHRSCMDKIFDNLSPEYIEDIAILASHHNDFVYAFNQSLRFPKLKNLGIENYALEERFLPNVVWHLTSLGITWPFNSLHMKGIPSNNEELQAATQLLQMAPADLEGLTMHGLSGYEEHQIAFIHALAKKRNLRQISLRFPNSLWASELLFSTLRALPKLKDVYLSARGSCFVYESTNGFRLGENG